MNSADDRLDRIVEAVQQANVTLESLRVSLTALVEVSQDHEQRLRTMERWRHNLTPIVAAITFMLGALVTATLKRFLT
jgi:hypothetical protein